MIGLGNNTDIGDNKHLVGIAVLLLAVGLSGCADTEVNNETHSDKTEENNNITNCFDGELLEGD